MDSNLVKAILSSCESLTKDLEQSVDYKALSEKEIFLPRSENIIKNLSTSLTKLLRYKVSREAYQRYSVRLHVIDVLRDWCRATGSLQELRAFSSGKQTSRLVETLLERRLTDQILDGCACDSDLLPLASALMCLASRNPSYTRHVDRLLVQLATLELSEEGEDLLRYAVSGDCALSLNLSTIEAAYSRLASQLIEQPLLEDLLSNHLASKEGETSGGARGGTRTRKREDKSEGSRKKPRRSRDSSPESNDGLCQGGDKDLVSIDRLRQATDESIRPDDRLCESAEPRDRPRLSRGKGKHPAEALDRLLKHSSQSPRIFQLLSVILKELFVYLDFDPRVLEFIQSLLRRVSSNCSQHGASILDLYPKSLQANLILLGIEPKDHTKESSGAVVQFFQRILEEDKGTALLLLSQFPSWFGPFTKSFASDQKFSSFVTLRNHAEFF